jgi:hypothetical protein
VKVLRTREEGKFKAQLEGLIVYKGGLAPLNGTKGIKP